MRFTGLPRQLDHTCHPPQRFYELASTESGMGIPDWHVSCSTSPPVCGCTMYCHGHAAVTGNDWPDTIAGKLSNYLITSDLLLRRSGMLRKWTWTSSHRPPRGERGISNWYLHSTMLHQPSETGCEIHSKIQKTLHLFGSSWNRICFQHLSDPPASSSTPHQIFSHSPSHIFLLSVPCPSFFYGLRQAQWEYMAVYMELNWAVRCKCKWTFCCWWRSNCILTYVSTQGQLGWVEMESAWWSSLKRQERSISNETTGGTFLFEPFCVWILF